MDEPTLTSHDQQALQTGSPFEVGLVLDGKYEIRALLGRGGMGAVYRVRHILLNVELALKTLDTQRIGDATSSRRFQTEAKAAFSLKHPNLVTVHDFGVFDDGHPFLVMDLVQGKTLQTLIKERGQLSLDEVESIFSQLCFGLASAHEQQVVHRDIKPANIMIVDGLPLRAEGSVKILDFGIAKIVSEDCGEMQTLTQTGEIFGSPYYMSPEQCSGGVIDQRSDIYSLGCVLFEALTGTPPLVGANALRTMMLHVNEGAPTLKEAALGSEFPEGLEAIVGKMLAKSSSERYANLGVVAHELSRVCSHHRKNPSDELSPTESKGSVAVSAKTQSITYAFTRLQLAMLVLSTASIASLFTFWADNYFNAVPKVKESQSEETSNSEIFDGPAKEYGTVFRDLNARTKLAFERIPSIVGTPIGPNRQKVVFPDEAIGNLFYGNGKNCPAKGTLELPISAPLWLEVSSDTATVLNNSFVFRKIDSSLITGLIFKGITQNSALEYMDLPAIKKAQQTGADELFEAASTWRRCDQVKLMDVKLTPSIVASINKMKLNGLHLNQIHFDKQLLEESEFLKKIAVLAISSDNNGPILKEVANSTSLGILSIGGPVDVHDIEPLSNCKNLATIVFLDKRPPVPAVMAAFKLKQVLNLLISQTALSKSQLKQLSQDWISIPPAGGILAFKRRV